MSKIADLQHEMFEHAIKYALSGLDRTQIELLLRNRFTMAKPEWQQQVSQQAYDDVCAFHEDMNHSVHSYTER